MTIETNEFFREATLRICGSLEVEEFLEDSYRYLSRIIPMAQMVLSYYHPETGQQTVLAEASIRGVHFVKQTLVQPTQIRPYSSRTGLETLVIDRAEHHPTAQAWIATGRLDADDSLMVMRVFMRSDIIGTVIFVAPKGNRYTRKHEDLVNLLRKPFAIALANSARYQEVLELKELLAEDYRELQSDYFQSVGREIVGARFGLKDVMGMVRQVAPLNSPVLLLGETGTGKELVAAAIHELSPRRKGPFIKVNCGAIPEGLMDSELFGHEKGAFTGALKRKRGRFERADGGTIFLDEIGELKAEVQVRLLRVLQEKEIERVGGTDPKKVDIRIVAATHRNLEERVHQNRFRQDLYFRLKVFPVTIPPLRNRKGDIPSLIDHFIKKKYRDLGLKAKPEMAFGAMDSLIAYHWPGNVRELENAVERAMILSRGRPLTFEDNESKPFTSESAVITDHTNASRQGDEPTVQPLDRIIAEHIVKALKKAGGKVGGKGGAAEYLELNPSTLRKKMRKLGIPFGKSAIPNYKS